MTDGGVSPQVIAPLEFARIDNPSRFAPVAAGPVTAARVTLEGLSIGWIWWSDAERAAGWVTDYRRGEAPAGVVGTWTRAWHALAAASQSPSALAGGDKPVDPAAGVPEWSSTAVTTLASLWTTAGRKRSPLPPVAALALEALAGGRVSGPALDAGLRGQVPMSNVMRQQVADLDSALQVTPTPEPLVVARGTSLAAWPGEPEALTGEQFAERGYFAARLGTIEPTGVDAVVHLSVPARVPALYTAPPGAPERGVLVLARDLRYTVTDVERAEGGGWNIRARAERSGTS